MIDSTIIVAIISVLGTVVGSFIGVKASNKQTTEILDLRLSQLEKKQDKHNEVIERTYILESEAKAFKDNVEEKTKVINHRIDDLEEFQKHMERK